MKLFPFQYTFFHFLIPIMSHQSQLLGSRYLDGRSMHSCQCQSVAKTATRKVHRSGEDKDMRKQKQKQIDETKNDFHVHVYVNFYFYFSVFTFRRETNWFLQTRCNGQTDSCSSTP